LPESKINWRETSYIIRVPVFIITNQNPEGKKILRKKSREEFKKEKEIFRQRWESFLIREIRTIIRILH
jgi:hypothetical protein